MDDATDAAVGGRVFARLGAIADRVAPLVAGLVVFGVSVALVDSAVVAWSWKRVVMLLCCAVCGVAAGFARRRLWPLFVVAAVAAVALLLWPAGAAAAYYAGTKLRRRRLVLFTVVAAGCYVLAVTLSALVGGSRSYATAPPNVVIQFFLVLGLPLVVGMWIRARRLLLIQLRDRADRLEREQVARAETARATERARIAREMHDILAHRVSLMVLHAGAIEVNTTDATLVAGAGLIRSTGRDALSDLRQVLGMLRTPGGPAATAPQPVLADLDALIGASRVAGLPVTHQVRGEPVPLAETVQRAAYRVVQEALTNVHKHAGLAATTVVLHYRPGRVVVTVRNAAPDAVVDTPATSGLGLTGLRERLTLLGGSCRAGPDPDGGFTLHAELPATKPSDSGPPGTVPEPPAATVPASEVDG